MYNSSNPDDFLKKIQEELVLLGRLTEKMVQKIFFSSDASRITSVPNKQAPSPQHVCLTANLYSSADEVSSGFHRLSK